MSFRIGNLKTVKPVQRWAYWAGWGCVLSVIPSVVWRLAMLGGVDTGFAEAEVYRSSFQASAYVLVLEVLQLAGGILCLGLIAPWGEQWPRWVPWLAGKPISPKLPFLVGLVANAALYLLIFPILGRFIGVWLGISDAWTPTAAMNDLQQILMLACYIPFVAWPVLLSVALVGFWHRHKPIWVL